MNQSEFMKDKYKQMGDNYTYVPHHMREGFILWIEHGIPAGSFGMAVIENDLTRAVQCGDEINKRALHSIVSWFYNYAPSGCWGSREKASAWIGLQEKGEVA